MIETSVMKELNDSQEFMQYKTNLKSTYQIKVGGIRKRIKFNWGKV